MAVHTISKGLDLPISGSPVQVIREENQATSSRVAVMADDFVGMKPRMKVEVGEDVKRGQLLFENRKVEGVRHTAPGAGKIVAINRGARRVLQSIAIELNERERAGSPSDEDFQSFGSYTGQPASALSREQIRDLLVESGAWVGFRTRPFSKVPAPESTPHSIFVTAMDTNPLTVLPEVVIESRREDFQRGLQAVAKLTDGTTFLCVHPDSGVEKDLDAQVQVEKFAGPHPAGTVGLHVHTLDPVNREKTVWHIGYQDVIAIGSLLATGKLDVSRVVALGGDPIANPRLISTRIGAAIEELVGEDGLQREEDQEIRLIAGSVLSGKKAMGDAFGYLGHYDRQISALVEGTERILLGWLSPGFNRFSTIPIYLSAFLPKGFMERFGKPRMAFNTNLNGSPRAMVPIGMYERVMPMDILPTFLLRSMLVGDVEQAEKLGCLELDEEDLALCTFVCPGKTNYGPVLRRNLDIIEEEG